MPYEYPKYPDEIFNDTDYPDQTDKEDWIKAWLVNALKEELQACLTELGTNPKGAYASVKARLDAILNTFLDLTDTPGTYEGQAGLGVKVNETEDGLEFGEVGGVDEKVKADANDPTAGYLNAKVDNSTIEVDTTGHQLRVKDLGIPEGKIAASAVSQGKLKTAIGSVEGVGYQGNLTLPGGTYGFYPQVKCNVSISFYIAQNLTSASYITNIYISGTGSAAIGAQQRYITASSNTHWIFLLYHTTKGIISGYEAPDHPSYGNGGDEEKVPHPFADYFNKPLPDNLQIILLDNNRLDEIKAKRTRDKGILEIISEEYEIDFDSNPTYQSREIIEIDEFGDLRGEVISVIAKEEKKGDLIIQPAKTLKKRTVNSLPAYIAYKSLKKKNA